MTEQKTGPSIEQKLPKELRRKRDKLLRGAKKRARIAKLREEYAKRREKST